MSQSNQASQDTSPAAPRLIASDASRNPPGVRSSAALTGLFVLALGCTFHFTAGTAHRVRWWPRVDSLKKVTVGG
jgi:hypothetical protein